MKVLTDGGGPLLSCLGNHDSGTQHEGRTNSRVTLLNDYFEESDYRNSEAHALFEPGKWKIAGMNFPC